MPLPALIVGHCVLNPRRNFSRRALLQLHKTSIPQRVQVGVLTFKPHINAVATTIFSEAGMKRLVYVTKEVNDEAKCNALLIPWSVG